MNPIHPSAQALPAAPPPAALTSPRAIARALAALAGPSVAAQLEFLRQTKTDPERAAQLAAAVAAQPPAPSPADLRALDPRSNEERAADDARGARIARAAWERHHATAKRTREGRALFATVRSIEAREDEVHAALQDMHPMAPEAVEARRRAGVARKERALVQRRIVHLATPPVRVCRQPARATRQARRAPRRASRSAAVASAGSGADGPPPPEEPAPTGARRSPRETRLS